VYARPGAAWLPAEIGDCRARALEDALRAGTVLWALVPRRLQRTARTHAPGWRVAAALATLVAALVPAGCGGSSTPSTHSTPTATGQTTPTPARPLSRRPDLQSIIEDEALLHSDPTAALQLFKSLGTDRARLYVTWSALAPNPQAAHPPAGFDAANPAAYPAANWAAVDAIIRDARAARVGIDLTVGGSAPAWANGPGEPVGGPPGVWKPNPKAFGAFVHAIGERYSGHYAPPGASAPLPHVDFWSIWNEPNYGVELAPQASDHTLVEDAPALYRGLVDAAWTALQGTGHGGDTILFGETAPRGQTLGNHPGNFDGMVPLRFIRALYCVGASFKPLTGAAAAARQCPATAAGSQAFPGDNPALFHAGGFADHPYPQGNDPPNARTPNEPDFADLASLPELEHTLDASRAAYGSFAQLPIYSTEFGYKTNPPLALMPSPATASDYLNWSEYISYKDRRVRSYDQYLIRDPPANGPSSFVTGLENPGGAPKPTYVAYRMPLYLPVTHARAHQSLEVWGCVRPAHYYAAGRVQQALVQFAPGAGQPFATIRTIALTDPHDYYDARITFPRSGRVRVAWTYPGGPQITSRTVSVTVG
jgi:hypothetical protein